MQKKKKIEIYKYYIALIGSFISVGLIIFDFFFILISLLIVYNKIKNYKEKKYDYKSLLTIDIFCLIILVPICFFWYEEILNIYAQLAHDKSLKIILKKKEDFMRVKMPKL